VELGAAKQRALLALLLIRRTDVPSDFLIDALWHECPPKGARNTLQVYVSKLRRALGRRVVETTSAGYRLNLDDCTVDADRFESQYRQGQTAIAAGDAEAAAATLAEALRLWRGPALADLRYEPFAQAEAGRLDELRLACLEERIEADLLLGRHASLVGELEALIVEQPLRERLRGQLITALYRSGRQSEALAQYQATRRMLADELGLEPSPELRDLERMVLAHDPELAAPEQHASKPWSSLPYQPTPFIGREQELAELVGLVRGGSRRLVTLTGPGGSGKTRLAIEAAQALGADYKPGVWWVPLQSVREVPLVMPAIASALSAGGDVAAHIGDNPMLVVLDNFEQVLGAGPQVAALLASCPRLHLLVTSRGPLRVAAEREQRVPPMTEPDAVALFCERAAHGTGREIGSGDRQTVAEICNRLDRMPLAVELAAVRIKLFTPQQILSRLKERLSFLARGPRDAPERQQTLRATLAWSYDLLDEREQRLFRTLSVFAGGCTYESAEAICGADPDTLESLLDNSLVERRDSEIGPRYSLLATIHEYADELVRSSGEQEQLRRRHADWYLATARRARSARFGEQPEWKPMNAWAWLQIELPNLRAALLSAFEKGETELAQQFAAQAGWAWFAGYSPDEGKTLLIRVLEETGPMPPNEQARILFNLAHVAMGQGDRASCEKYIEQSHELFEQAGEEVTEARETALCLVQLAAERGDLAQARSRLEHMRTAYPPTTDFHRMRFLYGDIFIAGAEGDLGRVQALNEEIARLGSFAGLLGVAAAAFDAGDHERVKTATLEYLASGKSKDNAGDLATAHSNLAYLALLEGDRDEAVRQIRKTLEPVKPLAETDPTLWAAIHEGLMATALLAVIDGENERSVRLIAAADALRPPFSSGRSPTGLRMAERYFGPARAELPDEVAARAEAEGAAMQQAGEAITYALDGLTRHGADGGASIVESPISQQEQIAT
jgi:predicted ATPase/DNA-binding SARP family transcriptional activator